MSSKTYVLEKAHNGYIIKFDHLQHAFQSEKLRVAKSLNEVMRIIKNDSEEILAQVKKEEV